MSRPEYIQFNDPYYPKVKDAILSEIARSGNASTEEATQRLSRYFGGSDAFLTHNCSSAILMSLMIAGIGQDDEVILPSFTFVTVANSICLLGGKPRYADVASESMNIDPDSVAANISAKTKAIIFMSYGGSSDGLSQVQELAQQHQIVLIEDAAYGFMMTDTVRQQPVGTIGDMACISFDKTKPYQCEQGGALIINNKALSDKAKNIYNYGTNRAQHMAGTIPYYEWIGLGFKFQMSKLNAILLNSVLEEANYIKGLLEDCHRFYSDHISAIGHFQTPRSFQNQFYLKCENVSERQQLKEHLAELGIDSFSHYEPLHLSPFGQKFYDDQLPVTQREASKILRLPFYPGLTTEKQEVICKGISSFCDRVAIAH